MGSAKSLTSWGRHGRFRYAGSPALGTRIILGPGREALVDAKVYAALLAHFGRRTVPIGASRNPPRDSLGGWLRGRVGLETPAAYVGPILVHEGLAERVGDDEVLVLGAASG